MRGARLIYLISLSGVILLACMGPFQMRTVISQQSTQMAAVVPLQTVTPAVVYLPSVHTETTTAGDLMVVKRATLRNLKTLNTYVLVENINPDPARVVKSVKYKLIWFDASGAVVAEKTGDYPVLVLPSEKALIMVSMNPSGDRRYCDVKQVRFEINAVEPVQMEQVMQDRVRTLSLNHPLVSINADPYRIEQKFFFDDRYMSAVTRVELHNSLNVRIHADVYGFYMDGSGEVVGVASNTDLPIEAHGSNVNILVAPALSAPVNQAEYYASVYEYSSWTDPYYSAFQ